MSWHSGSVFIIGPPVQSREVEKLVEQVLECVVDDYVENFSLHAMLGPVIYKRSWVPGGRAFKRAGLEGCELYCADAWWQSRRPTPESFTVSVVDKSFYDGLAEDRLNRSPEFETFVVSMFLEDAVKPSSVFEWMTYCKRNWYDRSAWSPDWNLAESERQHVKSVEDLKSSRWHKFLDIRNLFVRNEATSRRNNGSKGTKGGKGSYYFQTPGFKLFTRELRLDTLLPVHLVQFMASFIPRPASYEKLCTEIFLYELEVMVSKKK